MTRRLPRRFQQKDLLLSGESLDLARLGCIARAVVGTLRRELHAG